MQGFYKGGGEYSEEWHDEKPHGRGERKNRDKKKLTVLTVDEQQTQSGSSQGKQQRSHLGIPKDYTYRPYDYCYWDFAQEDEKIEDAWEPNRICTNYWYGLTCRNCRFEHKGPQLTWKKVEQITNRIKTRRRENAKSKVERGGHGGGH